MCCYVNFTLIIGESVNFSFLILVFYLMPEPISQVI
jgi:hypothetical protein